MDKNEILQRSADNIRILIAAMVEKSKSGHPGGAMGGADFITILFSEYLKYDPTDMSWANRDRFFLDPGHMSPMLYSILTLTGNYTLDDIKNFRQWGSVTPGHPEVDVKRGVENTSGPLGQGHAMALGAAITERFLAARFGEWLQHKTYAYISDGGIQEEISQGVGRLAGHLGLNNLVMFFDSNGIQLSSTTSDVTSENTALKYQAWGWNVITVNGHDFNQIRSALDNAVSEKNRPTLIIGNTIMGKGARDAAGNSYEAKVSTHGMPLSEAGASFTETVKNLGGNPDDPFVIFPEVKEYFNSIREKKIQQAAASKKVQTEWEKNNSELSAKWNRYWAGQLPAIDWEGIKHKPGIATRAASADVLSVFATTVDNMIVSSADLSNSDKTDGFLKNSKILKKGDFSGAFLQAGVAELTMAAVMNGMALHGGVIPVCATFFTFSDYMKPAFRLAALMELPVKYIFSHDAFRVGEDGPTHQPIEQETQIRLLEKMANLEGKRSMLVLRPADSAETTVSWKLALESKHEPVALLLSRQNIPDLESSVAGVSRYQDANRSCNGAYVIKDCAGDPDLILLGNGSEVATLIDGAKILHKENGLNVRIVSVPSEGLFRDQDKKYQEEVLPFGIPIMGLTAGLPLNFETLVGPFGKSIGLERFGASAPFKVLDEKFGYTAQNVAVQALKYLKEYSELISRISKMQKNEKLLQTI
jgi:transketolase